MEQGREHPLFISLFDDGFIVSGTGTNTFLIHSYSHDNKILAMIEMRAQTGRSQTAMAKVINNELCFQRGSFCPSTLWDNAQELVAKFANNRQLNLKCSETMEFDCLQPHAYTSTFYRVYDLEGEILFANQANFTFPAHQPNFDGCIIVENGDFLWVLSDGVVTTFALKVAHNLNERKKNSKAMVITKGSEPSAFIAVFPEWKKDLEVRLFENNQSILFRQRPSIILRNH